MNDSFMLGYDYAFLSLSGLKVPLYASVESHLIVVGGSNAGKSTATLYWLYKLQKYKIDFYIADFKASHDFYGVTKNLAEFEDCYYLIKKFYENFLITPEGGSGFIKILLIDEIAGLLTYYSNLKSVKIKTEDGKIIVQSGKLVAEEIRSMMSTIIMLGRSRKIFLWLSLQRYSANIFPPASGGADNFHICIGLGRLTVDGRKGLFAGEHFPSEELLQFGQRRGIVLLDGQPLKALIIPRISKERLKKLLT